MTTDAKRTLDAAHIGAFLIRVQNHRLLRFGISHFGIQHTAGTAGFAPVWLIAKRVLTIFDDVFALATTAMARVRLNDHERYLL